MAYKVVEGTSLVLNGNATKICIDNKSTQALAKNWLFHDRSKHNRYKIFIKQCIAKKEVELKYVKAQDQIVNIFIKPLKFEDFRRLCVNLGLLRLIMCIFYIFPKCLVHMSFELFKLNACMCFVGIVHVSRIYYCLSMSN